VSFDVQFEHNGMARCESCGEPCAPVLVGTPAGVEANPMIVIRCIACSAVEEAEAILANSDTEHER
jgi:hypothetical protein